MYNNLDDQENKNNIDNLSFKYNFICEEYNNIRPKKGIIFLWYESKKIFGNNKNDEEYNSKKLNNHYKNINDKILELSKRIGNLDV